MSEQFEVYAKPGSPGGQHRRVFAGDEASARQYVQDNFPRLHVEPGTDYGSQTPDPDAVLVNPGGSVKDGTGVEHFTGGEWVDPNATDDDTDDDDPNSLDSYTIAELQTLATNAGLSTSGTKAKLVARLRDDEANQLETE